jgi:hypothetical protein
MEICDIVFFLIVVYKLFDGYDYTDIEKGFIYTEFYVTIVILLLELLLVFMMFTPEQINDVDQNETSEELPV